MSEKREWHPVRERHPMWKGGRRISGDGYVLILDRTHGRAGKTHGYVREHIMVAEQMLGRKLAKGEVIHHKNRDRQDNRPENLQVCSGHAEHARLHAQENALAACGHADWRKCVFCSRYDDVANMVPRSPAKRAYEHRACGAAYQRARRNGSKQRYPQQ